MDRGAWWATVQRGRKESDTTEATQHVRVCTWSHTHTQEPREIGTIMINPVFTWEADLEEGEVTCLRSHSWKALIRAWRPAGRLQSQLSALSTWPLHKRALQEPFGLGTQFAGP